MKKVVCLIVMIGFVFLTSIGLADTIDDYSGVWDAVSLTYDGETVPAEKIGLDMRLVIQGTTVTLSSMAMGIPEQDFIFNYDGELKYSDGVTDITISYIDNVIQLIMVDGSGTYQFALEQNDEMSSGQVHIPEIVSTKIDDNVTVNGIDTLSISDWAIVDRQIVLAITNNGKVTIPDIELDIVFYDKNGNVVGTEKDGHDAVLPNSTVVTQKRLDRETINTYSTIVITLDTERYTNDYVNHAKNLEIRGNVSGDDVFLQVKNNDNDEIDEIEIVIVYYKKGVIVGVDEEEYTHLKSGDTHVFEFDGYKSSKADEYRYFINQAHTW